MEMHKIKLIARKRRADLLAYFNRLNVNDKYTITKFAYLYENTTGCSMSRARMSNLLINARKEKGTS